MIVPYTSRVCLTHFSVTDSKVNEATDNGGALQHIAAEQIIVQEVKTERKLIDEVLLYVDFRRNCISLHNTWNQTIFKKYQYFV